MRKINTWLFLILLSGFSACSDYTPKPTGYNRIDLPQPAYNEYQNSFFSFSYSALAYIDTVRSAGNAFWFNIVYPELQARIYCSYAPVTKQTLDNSLEDSRRLAYGHVLMADGIRQTLYADKKSRVSGIIYDIEGNVASPVQFFLTDSLSHFFHASLYYDLQVNADSVAPVSQFIRNDLLKLIESFRWQK
ncbi:MAG: hypothetical protein LBR34_11855 [Prevotella sp.]|jgi:gliding motility-associated lipoprotein GldD|nr:hypothetical protein [Prevotella sp.]